MALVNNAGNMKMAPSGKALMFGVKDGPKWRNFCVPVSAVRGLLDGTKKFCSISEMKDNRAPA